MLRAATFLLALAILSPASWAQTNMTPVPSAYARKAIARIIEQLPGGTRSAPPSAAPGRNGIPYNGGPIMDDANGVNVYFIWYGDWSTDRRAQQVLTNFIEHIGGSAYFNINTTYYSLDPSPSGRGLVKDKVINAVHYMGSVDDHYSQGTNLTDYQVYLAVANAITSGALPGDPNAVYFLLTSADVNEGTTFCTVYCAWHTSSLAFPAPPINGLDIKADGMADFMAHELEESVTDPDINAWVDLTVAGGGENGDMCDLLFPGPYHSGSANDPQPPDMKFGGIPYLIQENWVNANGGYCAIRWDE